MRAKTKRKIPELEQRKLLVQIDRKAKERKIEDGDTGTLIEKEERETGSVSWRIYLAYIKAIKYPLFVLTIVMYTLQGVALILNNFWLSDWSESGSNTGNKTQNELDAELDYYLKGYAAFSFTYLGLAAAATTFHIMFALLGAKRLHIKLLRNIVHAPMRLFDTTPIGRIMNRLSDDTQTVDQRIWITLYGILTAASISVSTIVVNTVVSPIFLVAAVPLVVTYVLIMRHFLTSARELQRLASISRSPVFAHFSETLGGITTIRAYSIQRRFWKRLCSTVDNNNVALLYMNTANRWVGTRLESIGALIVFAAGLSALLTCILGELEPSLVGLSLAYAISLSGHSSMLIRLMADCEMQMNAVERIEHYTQLESEQYQGVCIPHSNWPNKGDIIFDNISVQYAAGLDPVLSDVNVHFKSGQKIGICGRTGSGKSSLALSLFRIVEICCGRILIDGVDIMTLPLLSLRGKLAIIPQDPVLFQGTIRFNLDPDKKQSDGELWEALEIAQLKSIVSELDRNLDAQVSEDGENFSVGQRQLFCLARAFLKKSQILVMDEATASIDYQTDKILQDVISTVFADRTVITIAHRISTILDSDVVLVLSDGKVIEYDTPQNLLKKEDSMFASLVKGNK
uniref:ATP-binding cassette sub-family C member 8-like n=1 Tax=Saccoglossus kowalevskii TaxID=10224 RepID=A0ABM0M3A4_SACKO|nr:PREDICTED: ATP-binding cassette sub-family C member 8-like [Saccoglossus kowalevskii]